MTKRAWGFRAPLIALLTCGGTVLAPWPATAAGGRPAASPVTSAQANARPGANLILNPGAQDGDYSARGWDAVTIPGWHIISGLPTVVRYGTRHFPAITGRQPAVSDGQLFVGGAGGTARLQQVISLHSATGAVVPPATRYALSAWLGGNSTSRAAVSVTFRSASGGVLGSAAIGPVGGRGRTASMAHRAGAGVLPAGSASATVVLTLATSLRNIDGPDAPYAGYDRGIADNVQFSVSAQVRRPVLTAPAADIPRFQHVFLFYFENEDFNAVIGNTRQAPFLNSLLPHASLLSDFFAEEHPSDGNYLAIAGGSTFGIPLDDPLEENPQYTIRARNIGDLIDSAHETWRAYLQSADGPCDDTVHGYYWDDDMPMTYFADVRDRPGYCSAHLVPLQALRADLASPATTPNFAWVAPNDCSDMEGCGIRAGDDFLATELGEIMRSAAWRTQRSLAIITFDEDGTDYQHPAQRIATILIGSADVRQGYVSHVRYTHYSLLRTIEAALGLGTLTENDRYAQPVNDVFVHAKGATESPASSRAGHDHGQVAFYPDASLPGSLSTGIRAVADGAAPKQQTAFVVNSASNSVTAINLVTRRAARAIPVGSDPQAIAITPDGGAAYVVNSGSDSVTPVSTAIGQAGTPIPVGSDPQAIAITPDGGAAYVVNSGSDSVTPIDLATGAAEQPIPVGSEPQAIAITPDGQTAFVLNWGGASVTPISIRTGRAGPPIPVGSYPFAISVAPDGRTAYVANYGSDSVTPISVASRRAGAQVPVGQAPDALAATPDSRSVVVVDGDSDALTPISAGSGFGRPLAEAGPPITVGYAPTAVAVSAAGQTAFVVNTISGTVTPIAIGTGQAGRPISVGLYSYPTAIGLAPAGSTGVVVDTYGDQVTLINTASGRAIATINVGSYPDAVAIAP